MTASTAALGRGKPPLHTRFQRALFAALEMSPEALELSQPENGIAAMARRMVLDAVAGRGTALRLVLSRLDAESEREDRLATERNEADVFSLVQGESEGGGEDSEEGILQMERHPSPAMAQGSRAAPANGGLGCRYRPDKGRGEIRRMAPAEDRATVERNDADPFSLVQGESQGGGKNPAEKICLAVAANEARPAAPVHATMRAQLMMGTAVITSAPVRPARRNRRSAVKHSLVERAAHSFRIDSG